MKTSEDTEKRYCIHSSVHPGTGKRATIGGVLIDGVLKMGISICSPRDQFRRKTGFNKACGRALMDPNKNTMLDRDGDYQGPLRNINVGEGTPVGKVFGDTARAMLESRGFPFKRMLPQKVSA